MSDSPSPRTPDSIPSPTPSADIPPGQPGAVTLIGSGDASPAATPPTPTEQVRADKDSTLPRLIGRFRIEAFLGEGGFGRVYRAEDPTLRRIVALKVVRPEFLDDAERVERFEREARAAANLQHPNIVAVYDSGRDGTHHYIASAFIAGKSLDHVLVERESSERLSVEQAVDIIRKLAEALAYAHRNGVIHRDVKSANVLLRQDGEPFLTDFGLAVREGEERKTRDGQVLGTQHYMAPEQWQGKATASSDQYSLGCLFFELLTGRTPFAKEEGELGHYLMAHLNQPAPSPRGWVKDLPRDVETICLKCLEKDPAKRYADCQALADDLRRLQNGEPVTARRPSPAERLVKWARRNPAVASLLVVIVVLVTVAGSLITWQWQTAVEALADARREKSQRALAQINTLQTANAAAVPAILESLAANRAEVLPQLREQYAQSGDRAKRMRLALALLSVEPETVRDELRDWMLEVKDPAELVVIRDALRPHAEQLKPDLWRRFREPQTSSQQQLRLLAALALFDPKGSGWKQAGEQILEAWLSDNPLYLGVWTEALRPARLQLIVPLQEVFLGRKIAMRRLEAAGILADYARDQGKTLVELLLEADNKQFAVLLPAVGEHRDTALSLALAELSRPVGKNPERRSETQREALARRQANAAILAVHLGKAEAAWPVLKHTPYPDARSYLIARFSGYGVPSQRLIRRLDEETDVTVRRALIIALGDYGEKDLPPNLRQPLITKLLKWYREDSDAGIHGAIDWLLRHGKEGPVKRPLDWGQNKELQRIDAELAEQTRQRRAVAVASRVGMPGQAPLLAEPYVPAGQKKPYWVVNGQGMTMTVIPGPVEFLMGSPPEEKGRQEAETQHRRRIERSYAVITRAVTVYQWKQFLKENLDQPQDYVPQYAPEENCPINGVNWYMAAAYCNWLSKKEGIPREQWCYPEKVGPGMRMEPGYLRRTGYRLLTEAEWEYACRGEAKTSRYYGSSIDLLGRYGWYLTNSESRSWPVGQKRPNDGGLFDLHGNMFTWCQDRYSGSYPTSIFGPARDAEDGSIIDESNSRVLRGGSFNDLAPIVRSAIRLYFRPSNRSNGYGLRVSRTYH